MFLGQEVLWLVLKREQSDSYSQSVAALEASPFCRGKDWGTTLMPAKPLSVQVHFSPYLIPFGPSP